jgi:hypothetical protein
MAFNYTQPAITDEEIKEAEKNSGPRELAKKGKYKVRLHSMRGRLYVQKDTGEEKPLVSLFFINLDGNYKGAELTLFRTKNGPGTTTNARDVITILKAAGLSDEDIKVTNWAVDEEAQINDKGGLAAAFLKPDGSTVMVEGLEFEAFIDIDKRNPEFEKNVIKGLKILPTA